MIRRYAPGLNLTNPGISLSQSELPWRAIPFDERVLVFDTETTTDFTQRLLFGVFRNYVHGELLEEASVPW